MLQRDGQLTPKQDHTDQLFRLIVESATDYAIFVLDRDGRIASWNAGAGRLFGYEGDEIVGRDVAVLFTPEDRANGEPEAERARAERDGRALDDRWHLRKDGSRFFVSGSVSPLRDDAGAFTGFAKVCRDVTERERAKADLQKSRGRLGVALAAAGVGTWLWEVESDRDTLDENMCRMLGLPPEEREMPWEDFLAMVHPEDRGAVDEHIRDCLVHGRDFEFEFRVVRPDGIRWFRDLGKVLSGDDGKSAYVAGACLDITDRKRDEDALKDADRRKDEFLAMLAHELRNPLAAISGALQIAFRPGMEEHQAWVSEVIERQVRHLVRLVDDLLDVSRITRGKVELKRELVHLATHIHRAVEAVRPLIEDRRHELTVSLAPTPMALEADPVRLEQILVNLLTNAAKYTEPGGHIAVSATREGRLLVIRVKDDGAGIAPEMLPAVFDLFTQVDQTIDRSQGGLGIGLTLVKTLAEMHGGSVAVTSEGHGKGSEFVVRLPAAAATSPEPPRPRPMTPAVGKAARILVVDDNRDTARVLAKMLKAVGHEVEAVHDGRTAVEVAREMKPDAVLLDIGLPGIDGYQVARTLRQDESCQGALLIAVSGYGQDQDRRRSREAGFDHHLVKPADYDELLTLISSPRE